MEVPPDRALNIHGPVLHFTRRHRRRRYCIASFPLRVDRRSANLPLACLLRGSVMQLTGSQLPGNGLHRRGGYAGGAAGAAVLTRNPFRFGGDPDLFARR